MRLIGGLNLEKMKWLRPKKYSGAADLIFKFESAGVFSTNAWTSSRAKANVKIIKRIDQNHER